MMGLPLISDNRAPLRHPFPSRICGSWNNWRPQPMILERQRRCHKFQVLLPSSVPESCLAVRILLGHTAENRFHFQNLPTPPNPSQPPQSDLICYNNWLPDLVHPWSPLEDIHLESYGKPLVVGSIHAPSIAAPEASSSSCPGTALGAACTRIARTPRCTSSTGSWDRTTTRRATDGALENIRRLRGWWIWWRVGKVWWGRCG